MSEYSNVRKYKLGNYWATSKDNPDITTIIRIHKHEKYGVVYDILGGCTEISINELEEDYEILNRIPSNVDISILDLNIDQMKKMVNDPMIITKEVIRELQEYCNTCEEAISGNNTFTRVKDALNNLEEAAKKVAEEKRENLSPRQKAWRELNDHPTEPGYYWARKREKIFWHIVFNIYGTPPFCSYRYWDILNSETKSSAQWETEEQGFTRAKTPYEIDIFIGPKIELKEVDSSYF